MVVQAVPSQNVFFFDQLSQNMMAITQIVLGALVKTTTGEVNNFLSLNQANLLALQKQSCNLLAFGDVKSSVLHSKN